MEMTALPSFKSTRFANLVVLAQYATVFEPFHLDNTSYTFFVLCKAMTRLLTPARQRFVCRVL